MARTEALPRPTRQTVAEVVIDTLALLCRYERGAVTLHTTLAALRVDSLTLLSVVSSIGATFALSFTGADTVVLLEAVDVGDLVEIVIRRLDGDHIVGSNAGRGNPFPN